MATLERILTISEITKAVDNNVCQLEFSSIEKRNIHDKVKRKLLPSKGSTHKY